MKIERKFNQKNFIQALAAERGDTYYMTDQNDEVQTGLVFMRVENSAIEIDLKMEIESRCKVFDLIPFVCLKTGVIFGVNKNEWIYKSEFKAIEE